MMRRVDVQRWPAVPTAPNRIARTASSRFGVFGDDDGVVAAELENGAAEAAGDDFGDVPADRCRAGERHKRQPAIVEHRFADRAARSDGQGEHAAHAVIGHHAIGDVLHGDRRQSGAGSAGFQTTGSPHTAASAAFHDHTATGKLNAVITPIGPSGCHCSIIRWPGRSDAIVSP